MLLIPVLTVLAAGCSHTSSSGRGYDPEECEALAVKIERRDSLTQQDYAEMIEQNEQILKYIVSENERVAALAPETRYQATRELRANPDYMERFGYLFTIGSALFQAEREGRLDRSNAAAYSALDSYNESLARVSEQL